MIAARIAARGPADLVRAFTLGGEAGLERAARALGYEVGSAEPTLEDEGPDRAGECPGEVVANTPSPPPPSPSSEAEPAQAAARPVPFHRVEAVRWVERELVRAARRRLVFSSDEGRAVPERAPRPPALVPWPKLWRGLRPRLGQLRTSRELDVDRVIEQVGRGQQLSRLPFRERLRLFDRVEIVLDEGAHLLPFHLDQRALAARLERTLGRRRVAKSRGIKRWLERAQRPSEVQPLFLTDLGRFGGVSERARWAKLGRAFAKAGRAPLVLVPGWAGPWGRDRWTCLSWERAARAVPIDPASEAATQAAAERLRVAVEHLLALLAPAARIEPGLLRALRRRLTAAGVPDLDASAEAEFWNHAAVDGASSLGAALKPGSVAEWRARFEAEPPALRRLTVDVLREWHKVALPPIWHLEVLLLLGDPLSPEYLRDGEMPAAIAYFERMPGTMVSESPDFIGLGAFFGGLRERAPLELYRHDALGSALRQAWLYLERSAESPRHPPGVTADDLTILAAAGEPERLWEARQHGTSLLFVPHTPGPSTPRPPGVHIATLHEQHPRVLLSDANGDLSVPLSATAPARVPMPKGAFRLMTDTAELTVGLAVKRPWAARAGCDRFGFYAEFEVNGIEARLRWVPPGRFLMGSPEDEHGRGTDEPEHEVELTAGYWLGETACTQELWQAVMGENPSHFTGDDERPVEQVSWEDCDRFLQEVNAKVPGLMLRLPREAEWEYACRAGTNTPFGLGEDITPDQVNYDGNYPYGGGPKGKYRAETLRARAKELPPNGWGFHQMHGNVWEWCEDWYGAYPAGPVRDPRGPSGGSGRVLRGGSWFNYAESARSAYRYRVGAGYRDVPRGFRFARGQDPASPATGPSRDAPEQGAGRAGVGAESEGPSEVGVIAKQPSWWKRFFGRKN